MPQDVAYGVGSPTIKLAPVPIVAQRAPSTSDLGYAPGTQWLDQPDGSAYTLVSNNNASATWVVTGGSTGAVSDLTGDSGTANPVAGAIKIAGTTNQIVTTGSGSTITAALASAVSGLTSLSAGTLSATTTITAGTNITSTLGNITATAGNIVATLGNLQATNGNLILDTAGNGIQIKTGANATAGSGTLTSGTQTVSTTACTASSLVFVSRNSKAASTAVGSFQAVPGSGSFIVTSLNPTDGSTQTNDVSTYFWFIINPAP